MQRSRYTARTDGGVIVVEDQLQDAGSIRSVTNDAELVIADLGERGFDLSLPVIYRDTMGRWDGLTVRGGKFAGFYPLNNADSASYAEALTKLSAMRAVSDPRLGDAQ